MPEVVLSLSASAEKDALGDYGEFSGDLFPLVESGETAHLDEDGLPRPGRPLGPGMIAIGKIGRSLAYEHGRRPTDLEIHALESRGLKKRYGHLWTDTSVRVPRGIHGVVVDSTLNRGDDGAATATVDLRVVTNLTCGRRAFVGDPADAGMERGDHDGDAASF